jgi:hypothetical protein
MYDMQVYVPNQWQIEFFSLLKPNKFAEKHSLAEHLDSTLHIHRHEKNKVTK